MTFAPEYKYDVFISYSHIDNECVVYGEGEPIQWVTEFKEALERWMNKKLGVTETKIWMDTTDMPGNERLTKILEDDIKNSATLVIILSAAYINSHYCVAHELNPFIQHHASEGRIFIVNLEKLPPEAKPEPLQELIGYQFYDEETNQTLSSHDKVYNQSMLRLRNALCDKLQALRQEASENHTPAPSEQPLANKLLTVLIAEGTPDLKQHHTSIRNYLEKSGCRVLPEKLYRRGAEEYQHKLTEDLKRSTLFVQFLGPYATERTEDFPDGLEGLQLECAKAAHLPMLRGCSPDTYSNRETIPDEAHRTFLHAADIMAVDLEQFKLAIKAKLDEMTLKEKTRGLDPETETPIIIYVKKSDQYSAFKIRDILKSQGLAWKIYCFDEDKNLRDIARELNPAGLILVYGETTENTSIRDEIRIVRDLTVTAKPHEPSCALYFDPPSKRTEMLTSIPQYFIELDSSSEDGFQKFLGIVRAKLTIL